MFNKSKDTPSSTAETPQTISPSPAQSPQPTAEQPAPDRASVTIQILNGSGIPGKAGTVKDLLTGLGYQDIDTGNADTYDYDQTEISVADANTALLNLLIADLKSAYDLSDESTALSADSEYDAIIIVGKN